MSDSEQDWFEKDIDKFVVQIPQFKNENISVSNVFNAGKAIARNINYTDNGLLLLILLYRKFELKL